MAHQQTNESVAGQADELTRENFPLEVGDTISIDGEEATFIDWPTGGPQFRFKDRDEPFATEEFEPDEIAPYLADAE